MSKTNRRVSKSTYDGIISSNIVPAQLKKGWKKKYSKRGNSIFEVSNKEMAPKDIALSGVIFAVAIIMVFFQFVPTGYVVNDSVYSEMMSVEQVVVDTYLTELVSNGVLTGVFVSGYIDDNSDVNVYLVNGDVKTLIADTNYILSDSAIETVNETIEQEGEQVQVVDLTRRFENLCADTCEVSLESGAYGIEVDVLSGEAYINSIGFTYELLAFADDENLGEVNEEVLGNETQEVEVEPVVVGNESEEVIEEVQEEVVIDDMVESVVAEDEPEVVVETAEQENAVGESTKTNLQDANVAASQTIQYKAVIGKPVKWKKRVILKTADENFVVSIHKDANDIVIKDENDRPIVNAKIDGENIIVSDIASSQITGNILADTDLLERVFLVFGTQFNQITAYSIISAEADVVDIIVEDIVEEVEVDYETPPPMAEEIENENGKTLIVYSDVEYENVLTYAQIPETSASSVRLFWSENSTEERREVTNDPSVNLQMYDTNENDLVDYLEWNTPHTSNQTFDIEITVLNPYEYLKDGDTWIVRFDTVGIGNLTFTSDNSAWEEIGTDLPSVDEMEFLNLECGEVDLANQLVVVDVDDNEYSYSDITVEDNIKPVKFKVVDYSCDDIGYFRNYMNIGGYAILKLEFANEEMTVEDMAYDPVDCSCEAGVMFMADNCTQVANLDCSGDLATNGWTWDTATYNLTVSGDVVINGTGFLDAGDGGSMTFGSLTVSASNIYNATSGTTTITSENPGGYAIVDADFIIHNNGLIIINNGGANNWNIVYSQGSTATHGIYNLQFSGSGTFSHWYTSSTEIYNDLTIDANTEFKPHAASKPLTVNGDVIVNGNLSDGTGTGDYSFGSLTINDGGIYNATSGTTELTGITTGGYCIDLGGNYPSRMIHNDGTVEINVISGYASFFRVGTSTATNGIYDVIVTASGATSSDVNYALATTIYNDFTSNSNTNYNLAYSNKDLTIGGNLTLAGTATLPVFAGADLTVTGDVVINGGQLGYASTNGANSFGSLTINTGGTYYATSGTTTIGNFTHKAGTYVENGLTNITDSYIVEVGDTRIFNWSDFTQKSFDISGTLNVSNGYKVTFLDMAGAGFGQSSGNFNALARITGGSNNLWTINASTLTTNLNGSWVDYSNSTGDLITINNGYNGTGNVGNWSFTGTYFGDSCEIATDGWVLGDMSCPSGLNITETGHLHMIFSIDVTGDITVFGNLSGGFGDNNLDSLAINTGGIYSATSGATILSGDLNNSGTFTDNDGQVEFDSSAILFGINSTNDFYDLNVSSGTLRVLDGYSLDAENEVVLGGILNASNAQDHTFGSLTINSGGTYQATSGNTIITFESSGGYCFKNDGGTFTHNDGTLNLAVIGGGGATDFLASDTTFYDIQIDNTPVSFYTWKGNATVINSLTQNHITGLYFNQYTQSNYIYLGNTTHAGSFEGVGNVYFSELDRQTAGNWDTWIYGMSTDYKAVINNTGTWSFGTGGDGDVNFKWLDWQVPFVTGANDNVEFIIDGDCEFDNVTVTNGDTFDTNGYIANITGDLIVNGTFHGRDANQYAGSLTIENSGLYNATSGTTIVAGNLSRVGTFTNNSGIVLFSGSDAYVTNATDLNNVTVTGNVSFLDEVNYTMINVTSTGNLTYSASHTDVGVYYYKHADGYVSVASGTLTSTSSYLDDAQLSSNTAGTSNWVDVIAGGASWVVDGWNTACSWILDAVLTEDVTCSSGMNVTGVNIWTNGNSIDVTGGIVNITGGNLTVNGTYTTYALNFTDENVIVADGVLNSLEVDQNIVMGALTINDGGIYSATNGTTEITEDNNSFCIAILPGGTFTANTGTVLLNNTNAGYRISGANYYNFEFIDASYNLLSPYTAGVGSSRDMYYNNLTVGAGMEYAAKYSSSFTVVDTYTLNGTQSLSTFGTNEKDIDIGTLIVEDAGEFLATAGTTTISGDLTVNGILDVSRNASDVIIGVINVTGDVVLNGLLNASNANVVYFDSLTINNGGTYEATSGTTTVSGQKNLNMNGDFVHNDGEFISYSDNLLYIDGIEFYNFTVGRSCFLNEQSFTVINALKGIGVWNLQSYSAHSTITLGNSSQSGTIEDDMLLSGQYNSGSLEIAGASVEYPAIFEAEQTWYVAGDTNDWTFKWVDFATNSIDITTGGSGDNQVNITIDGDCEFDDFTVTSGDMLNFTGQRAEFSGTLDVDGDVDTSNALIFAGSADFNPGTWTGTKDMDLVLTGTSGVSGLYSNRADTVFINTAGTVTQDTTYGYGANNFIVGAGTYVMKGNNVGNITVANGGTLDGGSSAFSMTGDWQSSGGLIGKSALDLDGSTEYVNVVDSASLDETSNGVTIEGWVKLTDVTADQKIVSRDNAYVLGIRSGKAEIYIDDGGWELGIRNADGGIILSNDVWYHIVGVYDGSELRTYVNGRLDKNAVYSGSIDASDDILTIGATSGGASGYLGGVIGRVSIFNRSLTEGEIRDIMFKRFDQLNSTYTNNLTSWWQFDEGTGTVVADSSANGNDGVASHITVWASAGTFTPGTSLLSFTKSGTVTTDGLTNVSNVTLGSNTIFDTSGRIGSEDMSIWGPFDANNTQDHTFGSLTINNGGTYSATSGTTTITDWDGTYGYHNNGGIFTHNSGTLNITGGSKYLHTGGSAVGKKLNNVIFNLDSSTNYMYDHNSEIYLEGNLTIQEGIFRTQLGTAVWTVDGDVIIESGGTLRCQDGSATKSFGSLTINNGGTYSATSGNTTITSCSPSQNCWDDTVGIFINNSGTVVFDLSGSTSGFNFIREDDSFNNVIFDASGKNANLKNTDIQIDGNLTVVAGSLHAYNQNLTVTGDVVIDGGVLDGDSFVMTFGSLTINGGEYDATSGTTTVSGNLSRVGTFTNNSGIVELSGSSAYVTNATDFNNVTISGNVTFLDEVNHTMINVTSTGNLTYNTSTTQTDSGVYYYKAPSGFVSLASGNLTSNATYLNDTELSSNTEGTDNWLDSILSGIWTVSGWNTDPELSSVELYPASPQANQDLTITVNCYDVDSGDTVTAYWDLYKDGVNQTALAGNNQTTNATDTSLTVLTSGNTTAGEVWIAETWCGDGTANTSKTNSTARTIVVVPSSGSPSTGGGGVATPKTGQFTIDPKEIIAPLPRKGFKVYEFVIVSPTGDDFDLEIDASESNDHVDVTQKKFTVYGARENVVKVTVLAGTQLGTSTGKLIFKSDIRTVEVPIVVEVESERVIFDSKVDVLPEFKLVDAGDTLKTHITLLPVGPKERVVDATVTYTIKDLDNNVLYTESETFAVKEQMGYDKEIVVPDGLEAGSYVVNIDVLYENAFATSSSLFEVRGEELEEIEEYGNLLLILMLILIPMAIYLIFEILKHLKDR